MNKRIIEYRAQRKRLMRVIYILFATAIIAVTVAVMGWFSAVRANERLHKAEYEANEYRRLAETAKRELDELREQMEQVNFGGVI